MYHRTIVPSVILIMMLPRGIRNNNPLNIRRTAKDQWKGLRAQQTDASFCQFESLDYGWRAAFYLLTRTYYHKYRLFTIRAIINKWAPPQENLTATYIQNVPIGIPSDQPERWIAVGLAMAIQECGTESLDHFAMLRGWGLCRPSCVPLVASDHRSSATGSGTVY